MSTAVSRSPGSMSCRLERRADEAVTGRVLDSAELFRRYAPFVLSLIRRLGAPASELDDLTQEVFVVAHRNGGYVPGLAKPTTYLAAIAHLVVITERRKQRVRAFVQSDGERVERAASGADTEQIVEQREQLRQVDVWLGRIEPRRRELFLLAHVEEQPVSLIAANLGVNRFTVYSRVHAVRAQVRDVLRSLLDRPAVQLW